MPINHARKARLAELKTSYGVKHADAIALLDHPDEDERTLLCGFLATYRDVTTYKDALAALARHRGSGHLESEEDLGGFEYGCEVCGDPTEGFHCCECGASHEYHCVC